MATAERKEYNKQYYQYNRRALLANAKTRYEINRDSIRTQAKVRYTTDLVGVMLDRAKQRAKKLGIAYALSREDITIPDKCPVFDVPIERAWGGKAKPNSPSLDRIHPEEGYVSGNVQVISYKANVMKSNASTDDLLKFANWVVKEKMKHV